MGTYLSQEQINALIAAAGGRDGDDVRAIARAQARKSVKVYDWRRPEKFTKDQLRQLATIHQAFGRQAATNLSGKLRFTIHPLTMDLKDTTQLIYKEYVAGLNLPTLLVPLKVPQLPSGNMLLDIDLALILAFVDRLLGGKGTLPTEKRDPTKIEEPLILRFIDEIVDALREAWSPVTDFTPFVPEEPRLNLAGLRERIASDPDVMAQFTFEVRYEVELGGAAPIPQTAPVTLCIPYAMLEPVLPLLSATTVLGKPERAQDSAVRGDLEAGLQGVEIELTAILGGVEITVDQLVGLKPGDIIRFAERADDPVRLSVMDRAMAWGQPGRLGDHVALRILTPLQQLMEA
jgi:flagellar motor switch protein FliM